MYKVKRKNKKHLNQIIIHKDDRLSMKNKSRKIWKTSNKFVIKVAMIEIYSGKAKWNN